MNELNVHSPRDLSALSSRDSHYPGLATAVAHANLPAWELGQEIAAEVIDLLANGNIVLQLGGALLEAENPGQLHQGQSLCLQVEQLQPQVILHIIGQEPTLEDQLKGLLLQR